MPRMLWLYNYFCWLEHNWRRVSNFASFDISMIIARQKFCHVKMQKTKKEYIRGINTSRKTHTNVFDKLFCCPMDPCDDKYLHKRCVSETRVFVVITLLRDDCLLCNSVPTKARSARPSNTRIGNIFNWTCLVYHFISCLLYVII